jgi:hypothetical protein
MEIDLLQLQTLITEAREESKADRKKCWREDIEDKAFHDGEIRAYDYCLHLLKEVKV